MLRPAARASRGFTLLEMMVVVVLIGVGVSVVAIRSGAMLPQTKLQAQAERIAGVLDQARQQAVLEHETIEMVLWLSPHPEHGEQGFGTRYIYELADDGEVIGPGTTPIIEFKAMEPDTAIREVRVPGSPPRVEGTVNITVSPLGRVLPLDIVVHNPEFPDVEVYTIRVDPLIPGSRVQYGDVLREVPQDADFR